MPDTTLQRPPFQTTHWISLLELIGITAGFFFIVWQIGPNLDSNGLTMPLTLVLGMFLLYITMISPSRIHRDSLAERGLGDWRSAFLRTDNLTPALRSYGVLMISATAVILVLAIFVRPTQFTDINPEALVTRFALYLFSAIGQDLLFLSFFFLRFRHLLDLSPWNGATKRVMVCVLCASLFTLFHLPNVPVMTTTLLTGFASAWIWYATPNLVAAAFCHAVVGTLLHQVLEVHMRIGPFYWDSEKYVFRTLFPVLRQIIGDLY